MNLPLHLIPLPKKIEGCPDEQGAYPAVAFSTSFCDKTHQWNNAVATFCDYAKSILDTEITLCGDAFVILEACNKLSNGAYQLISDGNCVKLLAGDEEGALNAITTLIQLITITDDGLMLPILSIEDAPSLEYSSLMIDLARIWHDYRYIKHYIDLCRFYKIKVLHLHFTDNQSYTLPSHLFPKLSTPGRSYTFEQIQELNEYAALRGIQLMPEIDVPGHCTAFQIPYSDIFGSNDIICQTEESMKAMKALFGELCDMFPNSRYIHIGGDEAAIDRWLVGNDDNPYYRQIGVDLKNPDKEFLQEKLLANFVNEMANAVFEKGKQPIAWEGFRKCVNDFVRKDLIMISWENYYQLTSELLDGGYKIINCSWQPLYVCTPYLYWTPREIYEWNIFTWRGVHPGSPYLNSKLELEETENRILGAGLCSWNDSINRFYGPEHTEEGVEKEAILLAERLPVMSEKIWHPTKELPRTYAEYLKAYLVCDRAFKKIIHH